MLKLETLNELTLKVTCDGNGQDILHTKTGSWVGGECYGKKMFKFDKELLGPGGNPLQAALGQLGRRVVGENMPLTKVIYGGPSITYFANEGQHVTVINLQPNQTLSVESENLLAFTDTCKYGIRFMAQGVISQKGLATSTLTGMGPGAQVAILTDGNPIVLSNMQNGSVLTADPDAAVCWSSDPKIEFQLSWKNLIGNASGESYYFSFEKPGFVIIQPSERTSGIDIGMDGKGGKATRQDNNLFRQDGNQMMNQMGNIMGGGTPMGGQQGGLGGLGNILGGIINS